MVTNFAEMLPQERGILVVNAEANRQPEGSRKQQELLQIRNYGLAVVEMIRTNPNNGDFKPRKLNSRTRRGKLKPQNWADVVAEKMCKAGKTPQEIGAVVAAILGFSS